MKRTTQKAIRNGIANGDYKVATDDLTQKEVKVIAMSFGISGMNGAVFEGKNGELYGIAARSSLLFKLV